MGLDRIQQRYTADFTIAKLAPISLKRLLINFENILRSRLAAAAAMANDGHQNGRGRQATYSDGSIEREMERRPNDNSSGEKHYLHAVLSAAVLIA